jgi:peptidoglycan/xylan/chitin deacetylase (PgdA/CDA1 family)
MPGIGGILYHGRHLLNRTLACRKVSKQLDRPVISFTFDDFPQSAYSTAGQILRSYGLKATYYVAMSLLGTRNEQGNHFTAQDLERIVADGHELGCHTFHHFSCSAHSPQECVQSAQDNQERLQRFLPDYELRHFSFPFGHTTPRVKRALGSRFASCRSVYGGINQGTIDLNLVLANRVYESVPLSQIERLIAVNSAQCGWLVLYTHDVQDQPSACGCTPNYFEQVVRRAAASGGEILTIDQAVARLQP